MINSILALQRAANYLIDHGLHDIQGLSISVYCNDITLSAYPHEITESENRRLKRTFGPMKVKGTGDYKKREGKKEIAKLFDEYPSEGDDPVTITYEVNNAYTCRRIPKEELEAYDFQELHDMAVRGDIELPECKPTPFKADPVEETSDTDF